MNAISQLNQIFRTLAGPISTTSSLRTTSSKIWTTILTTAGANVEIPIGGSTVLVSPKYRSLSPDYERETFDVWLRLLQKGDVVWDIGANIGIYTILSAKAVGPEGQVIAFEPSPQSYRVTSKHIEINGLAGIATVRQHAVSKSDGGVLPFGIAENDDTDPTNRLSRPGGKMIEIPIESIDGVMQRSNRVVDYIKIDIEGAEMDALSGAVNLMSSKESKPVILLAVHPMFLPEFGHTSAQIADFVRNLEYESFDIAGHRVPPTDYAEYLLVPREKINAVAQRLGWAGC